MKLSIQLFLFLTGSLAPTVSAQCDANEFQLDLTTDNFGNETSWIIREQDSGNEVAYGPSGEEYASNTEYVEKVCIDPACYDFIIRDSYGDGLYCDSDNREGCITISLDGEVVDEVSGRFRNSTGTSFCTSDETCDGIEFQLDLNTDSYGYETTWSLREQDSGNEIALGPTFGEYASNKEFVEKRCIEPACYNLVVSDSYGDGLCCGSYGEGSILISLDGVPVAALSGDYTYETSASFCTNTCLDSQTPIAFGGSEYTCAQAAERCTNDKVASHCPFTCNACSNYQCADSQMKWRVNSRTFDCTKLSDYEDSCNYDFPKVASTCRESCDLCSLDE